MKKKIIILIVLIIISIGIISLIYNKSNNVSNNIVTSEYEIKVLYDNYLLTINKEDDVNTIKNILNSLEFTEVTCDCIPKNYIYVDNLTYYLYDTTIESNGNGANVSIEDMNLIKSIINEYINLKNKTNTRYEKNIEDRIIKLDIPNTFSYEEIEVSDEYLYGLKIFKDDEYMTLYYYKDGFTVCGTGLTTKNLDLTNGVVVTIGYYDDTWDFVSFNNYNKNLAFINNNLEGENALNALEIIKSFDVSYY